jgi:hypothetical protein
MYPSFNGSTFTSTDGSTFHAHRRERHQIVIDVNTGTPIYLTNGVTDGNGDFSFTAGQPIAQ